MSDSLQHHGLQNARPPCPSPTPRVYSNSCPLSRWCHLILCRPLLLLSSIFPTIWVFLNEPVLPIRWRNYWNFRFSISPSNEYSRLISFRMDWLDLLAVQGTLKSLLQHHSSKASILWHSAFFIVQLSHPYRTTGKPTALTRQTLVGKVMSLFFNMLSRLVITFIPRSKQFNFMAAMTICSDFGGPQNKVWHYCHCFPIYLPLSDGTRCHDLRMLNVKPTFSLSSFTFIKRIFSSSSLSTIRMVSSTYLRLLICLPATLISACASSSPVFLMMYSPYKLNKQDGNIQSWHNPFPIWNLLFHVQF